MFFNILKTAYRNLVRHKIYSLINILGLGLGMASCFLVMIWTLHEFSFDGFHENASDIYRTVIVVNTFAEAPYDLQWVPTALGPALQEEFPEIKKNTRIMPDSRVSLDRDSLSFFENAYYVDQSFMEMFSFSLIEGSIESAFSQPGSIIITSHVAKKFFGTDQGVVGESLRMSTRWPQTIRAVIEDPPDNSSMTFDILIPFSIMEKYGGFSRSDWINRNTYTYVQLHEGVDVEALNVKLKNYLQSKVHSPLFRDGLFLQPLKDVHLFSHYTNEQRLGSIDQVMLIGFVAVFILLIAFINFSNLSTARSASRSTEIGVRKVFGAQRIHLVVQFYGESILLSFLAMGVALWMTYLLLPNFNYYTGEELGLNLLGDYRIILGVLGITLLTGFAAGSYPAFFLSRLKPAQILQSSSRSVSKSSILRQVLIVLQFGFSVLLILCTYTVYSQLSYMRHKDLGYDMNDVIRLTHNWERNQQQEQAFRHELTASPYILSAAASAQNPTKIYWAQKDFDWPRKNHEESYNIPNVLVSSEYMQTMKMDVIQGEALNPDLKAHETGAVLLNEQAVHVMGFKEPIGQILRSEGVDYKIIGVLKETHFQPMHHPILPTAILTDHVEGGYTLVRLDSNHRQEAIELIQKLWKDYFYMAPLEYEFLEDDFQQIYRMEKQLGDLLKLFSAMAVLIACMGLFALAAYSTEQRTKEIGIRKVLGANLKDLIVLFSKDFFVLVLLANVIAWPAVVYLMKDWLRNYAYRIDIPYDFFPVVLVISVVIALVTVSVQVWKISLNDPVQSLRYE